MTTPPVQPSGWQPDQPAAAIPVVQPLPEHKQMSRKKLTALVLAALLAFSVVAVGAVYGAQRLLGNKTTAASVLPADTLALVSVDLSPSVQQKFNAWRFTQNLSQSTKDAATGSDGSDWRKRIWDSMVNDQGIHQLRDINYDTEIAPWVGEKASLAYVPAAADASDRSPVVVGVLEVSDEAKARQSLDHIRTQMGGQEKFGYTLMDEQVVVSSSQAEVDRIVSAGQSSALADNDTYRKQIDDLGELGVLSGWTDLGRVQKEITRDSEGEDTLSALNHLGSFGPLGMVSGTMFASSSLRESNGEDTPLSGQLMMATRFVDNSIEMQVRGVGLPQQWSAAGSSSTATTSVNLPDSTLVAYSAAGLDDGLVRMWPQWEKSYAKLGDTYGEPGQTQTLADEIAKTTGWAMPQDGKTLLGQQLTVALDRSEPTDPTRKISRDAASADGTARFGVQVKTDGPRFMQLVQSGYAKANDGRPFSSEGAGTANNADWATLASSPGYAQSLLQGGGLAQSDAFRRAVPNAEGANTVLYVDIDGLAQAYPRLFSEDNAWFGGDSAKAGQIASDLDSFGFSSRAEGEGGFSATLRLTAK